MERSCFLVRVLLTTTRLVWPKRWSNASLRSGWLPRRTSNASVGQKRSCPTCPAMRTLRERGLRLPTSTRTIWQLLDQLGLIERAAPRHRKPLDLQEPLQEVQVDFKDLTTVG